MPRQDGYAYENVLADVGGADPPVFPHRCPAHGGANVVGGYCEACEAPLFPGVRMPAQPHGYISCGLSGEVILTCPLGLGLQDQEEDAAVGLGASD